MDTHLMENISPFCTCQNRNCPLHPTKHNKGCAPCIRKNLRLKEVPNCFFNLAGHAGTRAGDSFEDFAKWMIRSENHPT